MGVLVFGGLCWIGWQTDGWVGGGLVMGWQIWYSMMFAFVGFHCFWGSGGAGLGRGNLCSKYGVST